MCNHLGSVFFRSSPKVPVSPLQNRVNELKQFSQQLQSVHPSVFVKALYRGILYQDHNIIAINKPYGVPLHSEYLPSRQSSLFYHLGLYSKCNKMYKCHTIPIKYVFKKIYVFF